MDTGLMSQCFLAESQSFALSANAFAKHLSGRGDWFDHSSTNDICLDCLYPERLYPMPLCLVWCKRMPVPVGSIVWPYGIPLSRAALTLKNMSAPAVVDAVG